jgi:hypothetical protein
MRFVEARPRSYRNDRVEWGSHEPDVRDWLDELERCRGCAGRVGSCWVLGLQVLHKCAVSNRKVFFGWSIYTKCGQISKLPR